MPKQLIIDGKTIEVEDGITLLQACEQAGAEIPRFCYHERLSIAGNCRMCLVEVQGSPEADRVVRHGRQRPAAEQGQLAEADLSTQKRDREEGARRRDGVPADQPPARLPDLRPGRRVRSAGPGHGLRRRRLALSGEKRAVEEKYIGPLIKTAMNRCIHCTRCVRFMTEVAGVEELGAIGRGEDMEITTYLEHGILSEMSRQRERSLPRRRADASALGAQRAPLGAAQDGEHRRHGCASARRSGSTRAGCEVMRILPRNNDAVNEEWISDKTRHVADGLKTQRLDQPYVRKDGRLEPASWDGGAAASSRRSSRRLNPARIGAIAGDLAGAEEMFALKDLFARLGVAATSTAARTAARSIPTLGRASYLFNSDHRGHRSGRRHPARRHQPAPRGGGPQCPHPAGAGARAASTVGLIGEKADLTYRLRASWRRLADAGSGRRRPRTPSRRS